MQHHQIMRAADRLPDYFSPSRIDPSTLVGTWLNYDASSRGISSVILTSAGGVVTLRVLGAGRPEPVEWGETLAEVFTGGVACGEAVGFKAHYDFERFRTMLVSYLNTRLLVVDAYTTFHDGSGRSNYFSRDHFYLR